MRFPRGNSTFQRRINRLSVVQKLFGPPNQVPLLPEATRETSFTYPPCFADEHGRPLKPAKHEFMDAISELFNGLPLVDAVPIDSVHVYDVLRFVHVPRPQAHNLHSFVCYTAEAMYLETSPATVWVADHPGWVRPIKRLTQELRDLAADSASFTDAQNITNLEDYCRWRFSHSDVMAQRNLKRQLVKMLGNYARTNPYFDVLLCGFDNDPVAKWAISSRTSLPYKHGEADAGMLYIGRAVAEQRGNPTMPVVIHANDTDVTVAALMQVSADSNRSPVYIMRHVTDHSYVDCLKLVEKIESHPQMRRLRDPVTVLAFLYAVSGCDYVERTGGVKGQAFCASFLKHFDFITPTHSLIWREGNELRWNIHEMRKLFFAVILDRRRTLSLVGKRQPLTMIEQEGSYERATYRLRQLLSVAKDPTNMYPSDESLDKHLLRAVGSVKVWMDAMFSSQQEIEFSSFGWIMRAGRMEPDW